MADINIPGVSDKYKTNDLVKSLVEVEKIPLKREQEKLEEKRQNQLALLKEPNWFKKIISKFKEKFLARTRS